MEALQNRGVAILLCALMILTACLAGTGTSLRTLREQCETVFALGDLGDGRGITYDLNTLASECYNITVIAARTLDSDALASAVLERRDAMAAAGSPQEKHRAAQELVAATELLAYTLQGEGLSAQDETLLLRCEANIQDALYLLESNSYNASARYFNTVLGRFPANMLGSLTGVEPLELFE